MLETSSQFQIFRVGSLLIWKCVTKLHRNTTETNSTLLSPKYREKSSMWANRRQIRHQMHVCYKCKVKLFHYSHPIDSIPIL